MVELGIAPTPENFERYYRDTESTLALAAPLAETFRARSDEAAPEAPAAAWGHAMDQFTHRLEQVTGTLATLLERTGHAALNGARPAPPPMPLQMPMPGAYAHPRQAAPAVATDRAPAPSSAAPLPREVRTLIERMDAATTEIRDELQASRAELGETRGELKSIRDQLNEAREAVQHDPLTGVLNRRGMDIVLPREVARARRVNAPLSVGMIDLDHFKHINDTFGHQAGDRVLVHMTELMRSVLRETDLIVRYGGEEFLVILPDTDMEGARLVLDRLQDIVVKSPVIHEGRRISVGFSAGVAQFRDDDNGATLVLRADRALQTAKRAGRSQVVLAEV
jgi:diguanylate cyclase (GGDEF)-like protein